MLFGKEVSYDRPEFYFTCARIRTYNQHMEHKSYCLEHTKPLFNEHKILNLENLYFYHMFMEIFKILKYSIPCSLKQLFNLCPRNQKFLLMTPKIKGGGGGGVHPDFFVKLGFEIAVDQQTRTGDQTFEGVPDPNRQSVPAGQPRPYLVQIRPNLAKYPEHAQNPDFRCSTCC